MSCLFCSIIKGEIPSKKVYEDESCLAFEDISPKAPFHVLVIPKKHIEKAGDLTSEDEAAVGRIFTVIAQIAKGREHFRVVTNSGEGAGQTVGHLHFHVLAGRVMSQDMG